MPIPEWLDPRKIATPQNLGERILTGINPLKGANPTTLGGRLLQGANPLNRRNILEQVITSAAGKVLEPYLGKETTDELVTRAGFYTMGPYVGAVGNFLYGRPAKGAMFNPDGTLTEEAKRSGVVPVSSPTATKQDPVKTYQDFRKRAEELYAQSQQAAKAEEEQSTPPPAPKLPPPAYEPPTPELLTVLAKLKGRPGVLNKETGEFTQQPWSATEAERYATYRAPASEEVVVTPSEDQVVEDLKAELLETALTGVGPSEGYESFQSQRLGDAIRQAQEDIIRRRVESGDLMYR
jgi:hypothetical protein